MLEDCTEEKKEGRKKGRKALYKRPAGRVPGAIVNLTQLESAIVRKYFAMKKDELKHNSYTRMTVKSSFLIYDSGSQTLIIQLRDPTPGFNALLPRYYEQLDLDDNRENRPAIYKIPRGQPACET